MKAADTFDLTIKRSLIFESVPINDFYRAERFSDAAGQPDVPVRAVPDKTEEFVIRNFNSPRLRRCSIINSLHNRCSDCGAPIKQPALIFGNTGTYRDRCQRASKSIAR